MTPTEYLNLAGEYCIKMKWNHDAIPELAKCLEQHDLDVVLKFARQTMDKQAELERENARLRAINQLRTPGSCQCGDDDICEMTDENKRLKQLLSEVARCVPIFAPTWRETYLYEQCAKACPPLPNVCGEERAEVYTPLKS